MWPMTLTGERCGFHHEYSVYPEGASDWIASVSVRRRRAGDGQTASGSAGPTPRP